MSEEITRFTLLVHFIRQ